MFQTFGLERQIASVVNADIGSFETAEKEGRVIAEGFLYTLPDRDALLAKLLQLVTPGGLVIISFNDRYGCLLEITKQVLLARVCQLSGVEDIQSEASLDLARQLYAEDFARLNSSRSFEAWWKDTLVNPFVSSSYLWSYPELLSLIEEANGEFYSSSPCWAAVDDYQWYKVVHSADERHAVFLEQWSKNFPYFVTGLPASATENLPVSTAVVQAVDQWIAHLSEFIETAANHRQYSELGTLAYPR